MKGTSKKIAGEALKTAYSFTKQWYFGTVGAAIAIFFTAQRAFTLEIWQSIFVGVGTIIAGFIIRFITAFIVLYRKEKRLHSVDNYGEAILHLKDAFARIHELRKMNNPGKQDLINTLTFVCGKLKDVYDKVTGKSCSICIKVIADDSPMGVKTELMTLCRDPKTGGNHKRTVVDKHPDVHHSIFKNTCFLNFFQHLGKADGKFYLNNNLPDTRGYENTSFEVHGPVPAEAVTTAQRDKEWPLPYKSELVVPISPLNYNHTAEDTLAYGFISVDSNETNAFNNRYDPGMLQGVADGIFDILHLYVENRKRTAGATPASAAETVQV
jgi:hypothetical protein